MHRSGLCLFILLLPSLMLAADPAVSRVLPKDATLEDSRFGPLRTLDRHAPFHPVQTAEEWSARRTQLQRQVLVATGLWPMPDRTPLNAVVHGRVDRDDYTVERVILESFPGHFLTGSLYRPKAASPEKRPGVLSAHGHFTSGRFHDHGEKNVVKEISVGAERFEIEGRHPLQSRCVQLVRMGCVVFHYDMIGYADSIQMEHRPGLRAEMARDDRWGFFSPQAELRQINMMGLQTWNSIRALDFLIGLEEVDSGRLAVTGASGGGTQTFMLMAVDERPAVAFPAVMVSTGMQGGCTCENASHLRVGAGNIDLAALSAPRPLGMTGADDWTKDIETDGLPDLKNIYKLMGAESNVMAKALLHFPHNFNAPSRSILYGWMNKHLKLGLTEPIIEKPYAPLTREELTVWNADHPAPTGPHAGNEHEATLCRAWADDIENRIQSLFSDKPESLAEFRRVVGGGWETLIGAPKTDAAAIQWEVTRDIRNERYTAFLGLLKNTATGSTTPVLRLQPAADGRQQVIWLSDSGKAALLNEEGRPVSAVQKLLDAGITVIGIDLLGQGEAVSADRTYEKAPLVEMYGMKQPWHHFAGYTFGYNPSLFAQRVHDVLTTVAASASATDQPLHLMGFGKTAGPVAAAAGFLSADKVRSLAVDTGGFRFNTLLAFDDPMFIPGSVRYGDVPALLALNAPRPLWVSGENTDHLATARRIYQAAGTGGNLTGSDMTTAPEDTAVRWLLSRK